MKVIALVGPSGTGKSHRALLVAHEHGAEVIIDDGLLIKGHQIVAGVSAKKQATAIGAIKTALFTDPDHAQGVKEELKVLKPRCVLILGTSKDMVNKIAARLELPLPELYLDIEDIASPSEITKAKKIRQHFGKHVIPAPSVAVKPKLSGVLTDPLYVRFSKRQKTGSKSQLWVNQTVVRPTFNYFGRFYIDNAALEQIIKGAAQLSSDVVKVQNIVLEEVPQGTIVNMDLTVRYGKPFPPLLDAVQERVKQVLEHMTALHVVQVNIYVRKLVLPEDMKKTYAHA
ncbi:MAG TPA: Asp23/Gls24 family envelope stress response protein [Clostridia bacterium]|nr:Asp23/Gls24 family envelope stress response protein [Clostridia bacterium]